MNISIKDQKVPNSTLTIDNAFKVFQKLKNYWAITKKYHYINNLPNGICNRKLFVNDHLAYFVKWSPKLEDDKWRRMTYEEFLIWYNIKN